VIRVANAPCSWGALEFDAIEQPAPAPQVLDEMAAAGYAGTELGDWGFLPTVPAALAATVRQRNLALVAAFVPVALAHADALVEGVDRAVRTARLLTEGSASDAFIVLADDNASVPIRTKRAGRVRIEDGLTADQWDAFAQRAERVAAEVKRATGLRTVFHHHCAGYVETPAEIDALCSRTDPSLSRREDWDYHHSVRSGIFCELGHGSVPFASVLEALRARHYSGWIVVEQDVLPGLGTPAASATRNRAFLHGLGI